MVQDEETAKFDGMPRAAASTGLADFVLPPAEMPAQLLSCLRHPYAWRRERPAPPASDETGLARLFSLLRERTRVDFTFYRPATITRRVDRRIAVTQVADLDAYVRYVEQNPGEVAALYRELLIGVTSFFRDPQVMTALRDQVLPDLLRSTAGRPLRFWVAGCSTGEEAYTMAILARETMAALGEERAVKIFATDIDRDAVQKAGAGVYPESIAADLTPELLARYFHRRGDSYQVVRNIREMVVFAQHNLVRDPPFTRTDLVSCRNLLIYLQQSLQQRALAMFDFSLQPGGVLVLGTSETVGEMEDRFEPVDRKMRIYRARGTARSRADIDPAVPAVAGVSGTARLLPQYSRTFAGTAREQDRLTDRLVDALAQAYVPPAAVVNERLEVLHTVGELEGILSVPSGRAVFDIAKMVDRSIAVPLATGVQKVFRTGDELVYSNVHFGQSDLPYALRLRIRPMPERKGDDPLVVVFFERMDDTADTSMEQGTDCDLGAAKDQRLQDLEQDLQFTRENLQATVEELETSNEELQATNEELLAGNEELQSTNEELQSTNEELYTVNAEYQNKIIELTEVQNDVDNLLLYSGVGILLLDEDLCVRRFSPQAAEVFHLAHGDVGRPFRHLAHRLVDLDPVATAERVQASEQMAEHQVQTEDGRRHLLRALPYRVGPGVFAGVVLTLVDITQLRVVEERLEHERQAAADIVRHMPAGLLVYEVTDAGDLVLLSGNESAERMTGLEISECAGKRFSELWPGGTGVSLRERLLSAYRQSTPLYCEVEYEDGHLQGVFQVHAFRLPEDRLAVSFENITEQKRSEAALQRIAWLLGSGDGDGRSSRCQAPYGDLVALNLRGRILRSVGPDLLSDIVSDYLDLLDTSAAVYEVNGDYALGILTSGWCRFLDAASRELCGEVDNREALACGRWLCHESCWTRASKVAIERGEPVDVECEGGLRLYALPIRAGTEVVGSINFGYGDPPRDPARLEELAARYQVDSEELARHADEYESRPPFIVELAKRRLEVSAKVIGELVRRASSRVGPEQGSVA
jgi:two-component system CheB/CheR fusion protein